MARLAGVTYRDDMFGGEEYPACAFFDVFPSSPDPYETHMGIFACHMANTQEYAEVCKGNPCKCPLAYGKLIAVEQRLEAAAAEVRDGLQWSASTLEDWEIHRTVAARLRAHAAKLDEALSDEEDCDGRRVEEPRVVPGQAGGS